MTDPLSIPPSMARPSGAEKKARALDAAQKLEATFLAEMLKSTGLGAQQNSLSGEQTEDHFASFHRQAIADQMVKSGGIGLTQAFYRAMMEAQNGGE
ncbi:rod-binding protein [Roseovarius sp.]